LIPISYLMLRDPLLIVLFDGGGKNGNSTPKKDRGLLL